MGDSTIASAGEMQKTRSCERVNASEYAVRIIGLLLELLSLTIEVLMDT